MLGVYHFWKRLSLPRALNLLGLGAAFTACYLLMTQIRFSTGYNKNIEGWENLYRLEVTGILTEGASDWVSRSAMENIEQLPQVEHAGFMSNGYATLWKNGDEMVKVSGCYMSNGMFRCFPLKMVCGVDSFTNEREVLLPRSLSMKMFGTPNTAGRHFETEDGEKTVLGVYEDFPKNCWMKNMMYVWVADANANNAGNWDYQGFMKLRGVDDVKEFEKGLLYVAFGITDEMEADLKARYLSNLAGMSFSLRPIAETYFSGIDMDDKGSTAALMVQRLAVLMLLLVAAINFANFTLAETPMRIRGVNTRKVLGVTDSQLRRGFILETVSVSLLAFLLSMLLVWLLTMTPWIQKMFNGDLQLASNMHLVAYIGAAAIAIGVLVGIYPAYYATSFSPALVLKGAFGLSPRGVMLRKSLMLAQFLLAFVLTFYLAVLMLQSRFIFKSDYGFDKDEVVYCDHIAKAEQFDSFRSQLEALPGVESVAFVRSMPGVSDVIMRWGRPIGNTGRQMNFTVIVCDWKFPGTMGIEIVEGRDFAESDSACYIFNEAAREEFGSDMPFNRLDMPVIGICKNCQIYSKRVDSNVPFAMIISGGGYPFYRIVARIGKNVDKPSVVKKMNETLKDHFPDGYPVPEFCFMDDALQNTYAEEFRFIRQVELFAVLSLLVTLVGVFCLTMFETRYRRREIALRRVLGTTVGGIQRQFVTAQLTLLILAFAIAIPLAWRLAEAWLENFAGRTTIPAWLPAVCLIVVAFPVIGTVALQAWRTCRACPVEALNE